jgi:hypothetical protein
MVLLVIVALRVAARPSATNAELAISMPSLLVLLIVLLSISTVKLAPSSTAISMPSAN